MNVLIIEDEKRVYKTLSEMLFNYDPSIQVLGHIQSVKQSIEYFNVQPPPDLVFMDVQLGDEIYVEILEEAEVKSPVIFTYIPGQYPNKRIKISGIYSLPKPFEFMELKAGMEKYFQLKNSFWTLLQNQQGLINATYKNRFLIKKGNHINSIKTDEIAFIYSREKVTNLCKRNSKKAIIDYSIEQLESILDPCKFCRINRSTIVHIDAIEDIQLYFNNRLMVKISGYQLENDLIVSREKVMSFKKWLDQ
jgi:two-component system LytT family response regulator